MASLILRTCLLQLLSCGVLCKQADLDLFAFYCRSYSWAFCFLLFFSSCSVVYFSYNNLFLSMSITSSLCSRSSIDLFFRICFALNFSWVEKSTSISPRQCMPSSYYIGAITSRAHLSSAVSSYTNHEASDEWQVFVLCDMFLFAFNYIIIIIIAQKVL